MFNVSGQVEFCHLSDKTFTGPCVMDSRLILEVEVGRSSRQHSHYYNIDIRYEFATLSSFLLGDETRFLVYFKVDITPNKTCYRILKGLMYFLLIFGIDIQCSYHKSHIRSPRLVE